MEFGGDCNGRILSINQDHFLQNLNGYESVFIILKVLQFFYICEA